jgi:hypothetical protein
LVGVDATSLQQYLTITTGLQWNQDRTELHALDAAAWQKLVQPLGAASMP